MRLDGQKEYDAEIKHLMKVIADLADAEQIRIKAGFDPNQQRDSAGRWGSGTWHKIDLKAVLANHNKNGGSTYTMDGKDQAGAIGMGSVSVYTSPPESIILKGKLTEQNLMDFLEANKALLKNSSKFALGTWYSSSSNVTYLDVATVIGLKKAIALGLAHNQEAIFDLENMVEISTGGTGKDEKKQKNMKKENWDGYGRYLEATKPKDRKITTSEELSKMAEEAQKEK